MDDPIRRDDCSDEDFAHEVMAACIDAWHEGGPQAAEAVVARHPELASLLRERLEKLRHMGMLDDATPATVAELPAMLGEFRLGKRIGSGGMGVVHVAEQLSLGRDVALKLVRPEMRFFPGARERFRREVEAIARLGDAGIVPIHCVGEDQGIDFFAMEYVRGASLGEVIAAMNGKAADERQGRDFAVVAAARGEQALPGELAELFSGTWVMACCRIVAKMARAAHHAHQRGVIHRDLKPNNAMVTVDGRVLLLDFGLAAAAGTSRITRSGAVLGTLHYMAPEQLQEGEVDARTDVYALGVTLHELLVLRPPFHAGSEHALRQQILRGDAASLRTANSEVPRDVATIVAVASDRDPARRYATAEALASDLERFLQHRPVLARPVGPLTRTTRWAHRHPALATGMSLLLLGAVALPFVVKWSRGEVEARVETAEQRARANLQGALDAVSWMLKQVRSPAMRQRPGLDDERRRQVDEAAAVIAKLHQENPDDDEVTMGYVRGALRVAEFRRLFGDHQGALAALDGGEPALRALRTRLPNDQRIDVEEIAFALNRGSSLAEQGQVGDAAVAWRAVVERFDGRDVAKLPRAVVAGLASCHNNLGRIAHSEHDDDAAIRHLQIAVDLERGIEAASDTIDYRIDCCRTRLNLAAMHRAKDDLVAAEAQYAEVAATLAQLAIAAPDDPEVQRELARTSVARAALVGAKGDFAGSRSLRDQAIAQMERIVVAFPDRLAYRQEFGLMLHDAAVESQVAKDLDASAAYAERAVGSHRLLLQRAPENAEFVSQMAVVLRQRSVVALLQKDKVQAFACLNEAIELQEKVVRMRADEPYYMLDAAALYQELGIYHMRDEAWPEARDALRHARDCYEAALAKGYAPAREVKRLPKLLTVLAQAELMCDDFDAVMACLRRHQEVHAMARRELQSFGEKLHVDDRDDFQELVRAAPAGAR